MWLLLLCLTLVRSEPLGEAIKRRSNYYGVYASDYAEDYEPMAFAALPLHRPVPIVHLLSPMPLANGYGKAKHAKNKPKYNQQMYASSMAHVTYANPPYRPAYEPPSFDQPLFDQSYERIYEQPYERPVFDQTSYAESAYAEPSLVKVTTPIVLYARPNEEGGYSYRRQPSKKRQPPPKSKAPVILRIHKYRIVRDR